MLHASSASTVRPPGVLARRASPMIDLYRKRAFSTRRCRSRRAYARPKVRHHRGISRPDAIVLSVSRVEGFEAFGGCVDELDTNSVSRWRARTTRWLQGGPDDCGRQADHLPVVGQSDANVLFRSQECRHDELRAGLRQLRQSCGRPVNSHVDTRTHSEPARGSPPRRRSIGCERAVSVARVSAR